MDKEGMNSALSSIIRRTKGVERSGGFTVAPL
jgi:hypothetical protein